MLYRTFIYLLNKPNNCYSNPQVVSAMQKKKKIKLKEFTAKEFRVHVMEP